VSYWTDSTSTDFPYYEVVYVPAAYVSRVDEMKQYYRAHGRISRYFQWWLILIVMMSDNEKKRMNIILWTTKVVDNLWRTKKAFWRWKLRS
jgi:hypothetical protein